MGVWLIVILVAVAYYLYFNTLKSIGDLIIFIAPVILFATVGSLLLARNQKTVRKAKEKTEYHIAVQLNWGMALKHDIVTYFLPVLIILTPLLFKESPTSTDVLQACLAFVGFNYLKLLYWNHL